MLSDLSLDDALREPSARSRPLCVALDGTLVTTRLLSERMALLFRQRPWAALALPFWVLGGRDRLRARLANVTSLSPASLPYRAPLLAALKLTRESGRRVVLAASNGSGYRTACCRPPGRVRQRASRATRPSRSQLPQNLRETLLAAYSGGVRFHRSVAAGSGCFRSRAREAISGGRIAEHRKRRHAWPEASDSRVSSTEHPSARARRRASSPPMGEERAGRVARALGSCHAARVGVAQGRACRGYIFALRVGRLRFQRPARPRRGSSSRDQGQAPVCERVASDRARLPVVCRSAARTELHAGRGAVYLTLSWRCSPCTS